MSFKEFEIVSPKNVKLIGNSWVIDNPKGNVIIAHGMAEYSLRYSRFAEYLNENGFNVYMIDHLGHGKNKGEGYGVWSRNGFAECVDNVNALTEYLAYTELPLYVMGHSMGSFITQSFIERYNPKNLKKVVLIGTSGPQGLYKIGSFITKVHAIGKNGKKPSKFLNKVTFSSYGKRIPNPKTEFDWLSVEEENVKKYIADEGCGFVPSINFFVSFTGSLAKLHKQKNIDSIDKSHPILIVAGKEDPVGNYGKAVKKLQDLYTKNKIDSEMILYENMRHEILNENEKEKVYQDIVKFLEK